MTEQNLPDMRIGALTACAPAMSLEDWMKQAQRIGLDGLEVAAHPSGTMEGRKDWVAKTLNLSDHSDNSRIETTRKAKELSFDYEVPILSLGCYENMLQQPTGASNRVHLMKVIDAAALLKEVMPAGPLVATFVGADPNLRMQENYELFKNNFLPLVKYAKQRGVRIMVENCPMEGWESTDRPVNQLMSSPRLWDACFQAAKEKDLEGSLGLEYDASHRIWQTAGRMMYVANDVQNYGSKGKIFALHGKGATFTPEGLWKDGIDGQLIDLDGNEWAKRASIYEHAVPGVAYDSVDWNLVISDARKVGVPFINIEIEDPHYKDTDPVKSGELGIKAVEIGRANLMPHCYSDKESYQASS